MDARARELEQVLEGGLRLRHDGLPRPAAAHGHHDDVAIAREEPCDVPCDRGLADPLPRADHGQGRQLKGLEPNRVEAKVGPDVREPRRESLTRQREAAPRIEDGLVGEVDHRLGLDRRDRLGERPVEGDPIVLVAAKLLRPAHEHCANDVVRHGDERHSHDVGIVLPVDEGDHVHGRLVTSSSMRVVYFSNSSVSAEN
jgi:hypothetical protein